MPADPWQVSEPVFAATISLLSLVWVLFLQNSGIGGCCQWWMSPCLCTSRIQSIPSVRRRECSMCAHPWGHWDGVWAGLGGLDSSNEANRYKKEPSRRHSGALYSLVRRQIEFRCHLFSLKKTVLCDKPQKQYYSFNLLLYSFNMLLDLITIFLKILVSPFMRVLGLWFLFLYYLCLVSVSRLYWPHKMSYFLHFFLLEEIV